MFRLLHVFLQIGFVKKLSFVLVTVFCSVFFASSVSHSHNNKIAFHTIIIYFPHFGIYVNDLLEMLRQRSRHTISGS